MTGWPAAHVAEQLGISRATAYKWVRRYRAEGEAGLLDRSSPAAPLAAPPAADALEAQILAARADWRYGPDRLGPLLGLPPSTVHRVLQRHGLSRLRDADRVTTARSAMSPATRVPSLHQDHKKLGGSPTAAAGGCSAALGDPPAGTAGRGYDHLEVVIDDASRYAVVVPVPDETGRARRRGARGRRGRVRPARHPHRARPHRQRRRLYDPHAYARTLDRLGARHKRTRPWRPQTNGKAERVIQTLLREWAYGRPYEIEPGARRMRSRSSSTSTIGADPTRRSADDHPSMLSTTAASASPRMLEGAQAGTTTRPPDRTDRSTASTNVMYATAVGKSVSSTGAPSRIDRTKSTSAVQPSRSSGRIGSGPATRRVRRGSASRLRGPPRSNRRRRGARSVCRRARTRSTSRPRR